MVGKPQSPLVHAAWKAFKGWDHPHIKKLMEYRGLVPDQPRTLQKDVYRCIRDALPELSEAAAWELLTGRASAPCPFTEEDIPPEVWD